MKLFVILFLLNIFRSRPIFYKENLRTEVALCESRNLDKISKLSETEIECIIDY